MKRTLLVAASLVLFASNAEANPLFTIARKMVSSETACAPATPDDARCNCRSTGEKVLDYLEGKKTDCK